MFAEPLAGNPEFVNAWQAAGLIGVVILLAPLVIVAICDAIEWLDEIKDKRK